MIIYIIGCCLLGYKFGGIAGWAAFLIVFGLDVSATKN